jgi:hypothetical protein
MAIIPTPAPGTIIDVEKLSEIITVLNKFATDYGSQKNSTISTTKQSADTKIATPNLSFSAGKVMVTSDNNVKTKDVIPFSFEFGRTFAYPPTVTATPQSSATGLKSAVTSNVSIIINNVTTTKVEGSVYFNSEAKQTNIYIHIIAIGSPIGV